MESQLAARELEPVSTCGRGSFPRASLALMSLGFNSELLKVPMVYMRPFHRQGSMKSYQIL